MHVHVCIVERDRFVVQLAFEPSPASLYRAELLKQKCGPAMRLGGLGLRGAGLGGLGTRGAGLGGLGLKGSWI